MGTISSLEVGRDASLFHGPGESPVMRGEGSGVMSAIAFNIGEEKAELGADPNPELLPKLLAKMFFILGVRARGAMPEGALAESTELRAVVLLLAVVTV